MKKQYSDISCVTQLGNRQLALRATTEGRCPKPVLPEATIQNSGPARNLASC
jgi:hypothetical protein